MASLLRNISSRFTTPTQSSTDLAGFSKASAAEKLFPKTDPAVDGEDCLHDCESCTIKYPRKFQIDEDANIYGHTKEWSTHLIVATGKSDWLRDLQDEKGSVMEAVHESKAQPKNGNMRLSASNMPIPHTSLHDPEGAVRTRVLLLPAFKYIDNVTPAAVPDLIQSCVDTAPTTTTPLSSSSSAAPPPPPATSTTTTIPLSLPTGLEMRDCPHRYLILLCSHMTVDARCGQSAPLLRREFERHLRPLGLYRDLEDERPGGVGIYFISHVGGHKFAANVIVYRRGSGTDGDEGDAKNGPEGEAAQCIWLARVKPADVEGVVKYTVLQGKVVDPDRQLRGGFDRYKRLTSW